VIVGHRSAYFKTENSFVREFAGKLAMDNPLNSRLTTSMVQKPFGDASF